MLGGGGMAQGESPRNPMTDKFPRDLTSTTNVGCRSYVHSEPPRRKGLKISGLLVSRPTAVELMPPQRPRLPIGATLCSARRPSLSVLLFLFAVASTATSASGSAVDWLRQSASASSVAPAAVSAPAPNLQPNQWGKPCCRSAVPNV